MKRKSDASSHIDEPARKRRDQAKPPPFIPFSVKHAGWKSIEDLENLIIL
jgi:hypothetical protein